MNLLPLLACTPPPTDAPVVEATLTPSEAIPTVATLRWETDTAMRTRVRFGAARTLHTALDAAATRHEAVLVGVPAETDATWEILDEDDAVLASGEWTTGRLAGGLPDLTVTGEGNDQFVFTSILGGTTAAVLLSPDGEIVWWHFTEPGLDTYRVRPARVGAGVIYNAASVAGDPAELSKLVSVPWDGSGYLWSLFPLLAHDWVELPDGNLAVMQVRYDGELRGDAIVELSNADGSATDIWTSWDCFDPATQPGDTPTIGWTWANALDYDATTETYLLGLRNLSSIAWIDRATGACERVVGEAGTPVEGERFRHQHQFHAFEADDGEHLLVFDNDGAGGNTSRVLEYALDGDVAREVWSYTPSPSIYGFVLGDVQRLDDGDTMVTWSTAGRIERVAPDGTPTWTVQAEEGYAFGFTTLAPTAVPE